MLSILVKWGFLMTQDPRPLPWAPLQATHPLSKPVYGTGLHLVQQSHENEGTGIQEPSPYYKLLNIFWQKRSQRPR